MTNILSKLELRGVRIEVAADHASAIIVNIFNRLGCQKDISLAITKIYSIIYAILNNIICLIYMAGEEIFLLYFYCIIR